MTVLDKLDETADASATKTHSGSLAPSARLLCQRGDGIGGRLLTLLWTLRLARTVDAGVLMFWPSLDLFSYQGSVAGDLFDQFRLANPPFQNRLQIVDGDCEHYFHPSPIHLHKRQRCEPSDLLVPVDPNSRPQKLPVVFGGWEGPMLAPGEDRNAVLAEMPSLFAELPFRDDVMCEVDRITRKHRLSKAVAVHVRRGEIVQNLREAVTTFRLGDPSSEDQLDRRVGTFFRRCMSVEDFAAALRGFVDRGLRIVLFSDEPTIHKDLSDALGTSEIVAAASLIEPGFTPIQLAFIDAVLMSKCRCIVGGRSAYGEFAQIIGGHARVVLTSRGRSAEDCAAFMLASISDELGSHPERMHIERRLHDELIRLHG